MVFAAMFRQKMRREGREQGRTVGRKEANAAWREGNQRRKVAIVEGKPFDEPTPDARDGTRTAHLTAARSRNASGRGDAARKKWPGAAACAGRPER